MDIEKQKNKAKNAPERLNCVLILKICSFFILSLIAVVALLIIYAPTGEIHQTSLPDNLRPTAEFVRNISSGDDRVELDDGIEVSISYSLNDYMLRNIGDVICIYGNLPLEKLELYFNNSRLFVNGNLVRGNISASRVGWGGFERCVHGFLEPGLHLIEFHLRDSFFGAPLAIQQWAIEVE